MVEIPEALSPIPESEGAKPDGNGCVIFDHVSFSYDKAGRPVSEDAFAGSQRQKCLDDISFTIPRGGSLGVIGATGAGKTSLVNLLMRFYDPDEGHVFVDGKDVRTYERDAFHRLFGVVFQNDVIFADTVRSNIAFGREITESQMKSAAADAMAAEFIESYDDGYDHRADIHGANFSGGQKQRLLIARALAAKPKILILDDASSALDYRTDALLRKAIREHYAPDAQIVIAQRISSIMNLDRVLMLDEGKPIGYGTHEELLETCPAYRDIYETQMGDMN